MAFRAGDDVVYKVPEEELYGPYILSAQSAPSEENTRALFKRLLHRFYEDMISEFHIIAVDYGIRYAFYNSTFRIIRTFFPMIYCFPPPLLAGDVSHKGYGLLKHIDNTTTQFYIIIRFAKTIGHVKPIPTGTKYP